MELGYAFSSEEHGPRELVAVVVTLVLLLLSEGYHRSIYTTVPLVLAAVSLVSGFVFARFMERRV